MSEMTWALLGGVAVFVLLGLLVLAAWLFQEHERKQRRPMPRPAPIALRRAAPQIARHRYRMEQLARVKRRTVPPYRPIVLADRITEPRDITAYRPLDAEQQAHVRRLIAMGDSNNSIYSVFKGTRARRLAEITEIRAAVDAESLAKVLARPEIAVPDREPIPA
jgi:hypothetical protein